MGRADRERELRKENTRMKAALAAIHNALHANETDRAHELCECAIDGEEVAQPNLTVVDSAKAMTFAADFNRLAARAGIRACAVVMLSSATDAQAVSLQLIGNVGLCRVVESKLRGSESKYMGDHKESAGG